MKSKKGCCIKTNTFLSKSIGFGFQIWEHMTSSVRARLGWSAVVVSYINSAIRQFMKAPFVSCYSHESYWSNVFTIWTLFESFVESPKINLNALFVSCFSIRAAIRHIYSNIISIYKWIHFCNSRMCVHYFQQTLITYFTWRTVLPQLWYCNNRRMSVWKQSHTHFFQTKLGER